MTPSSFGDKIEVWYMDAEGKKQSSTFPSLLWENRFLYSYPEGRTVQTIVFFASDVRGENFSCRSIDGFMLLT